MALRARLLLFALACAASWTPTALAQGIAYTVQAIAVSEQATAIDLSRGLLRDGFPAYVVRSTGGQGDVYRVRVGAFANRAAALRYADAMPAVGGARPVPALAEAIPQGIMPWAPRVTWQAPWDGEDVLVMPWPGGGVAIRTQPLDPLRQATYALVQAGETRTILAWRLTPLAALPEAVGIDTIDVPFVDLTLPQPQPDPAARSGAISDRVPVPDVAVPPEREEPEGAVPEGDAGDAALAAIDAPVVASVEGPADVGLWLLRDRAMWPGTWSDDEDEVRAAFRASTVNLVASGADLAPDVVDAAAYLPWGEPPPTLVVVEVSDRSGRDTGDVRALGDAPAGLAPFGPEPLPGGDPAWWPPVPEGESIDPAAAAAGPWSGEMGTIEADDGFVRLRPDAGTSWRAAAGRPLWSDGRFVLLRDGDDLVLVDFVPR